MCLSGWWLLRLFRKKIRKENSDKKIGLEFLKISALMHGSKVFYFGGKKSGRISHNKLSAGYPAQKILLYILHFTLRHIRKASRKHTKRRRWTNLVIISEKKCILNVNSTPVPRTKAWGHSWMLTLFVSQIWVKNIKDAKILAMKTNIWFSFS